MRIVAHLGVLDEVELVGRCLDQLAAIGVAHVIVFDMGSTDGTLQLLERRRGDGLEVLRLSNRLPWEDWERIALERVRAAEADWVLFLDADELWVPAGGRLEECASLAAADVVTVPRYNVVLTADGPRLPDDLHPGRLGELLLWSRPIPAFREHLGENPDASWIRGVPVPKVIGRPQLVDSITMGTHDLSAGAPVRRGSASDLLIAHLPFSTAARFERRIANLRDFFAFHPDYFTGHQGWHWRRWMALAEQGRTAEEFARQVVGEAELAGLRAEGVVRSAAELLAGG